MADLSVPVARSPIKPLAPVGVVDGWERSVAPSRGGLRLCDLSHLAKVQVRAASAGSAATQLGVPAGRAVRDATANRLVVGSGPGEWLVIAPAAGAAALVGELDSRLSGAGPAGGEDGELVSVVDLTHGRALVRLSGPDAVRGVLAKLCPVDLADAAVPDATALRTSMAGVVTDLVRDDLAGELSYLLHCDRSSGQYLFDTLLDAGADHATYAYGATEKDW